MSELMSMQELIDKHAGVGDSIETTLSDGKKLVMVLGTPEAAAYANHLIEIGRWKKVLA